MAKDRRGKQRTHRGSPITTGYNPTAHTSQTPDSSAASVLPQRPLTYEDYESERDYITFRGHWIKADLEVLDLKDETDRRAYETVLRYSRQLLDDPDCDVRILKEVRETMHCLVELEKCSSATKRSRPKQGVKDKPRSECKFEPNGVTESGTKAVQAEEDDLYSPLSPEFEGDRVTEGTQQHYDAKTAEAQEEITLVEDSENLVTTLNPTDLIAARHYSPRKSRKSLTLLRPASEVTGTTLPKTKTEGVAAYSLADRYGRKTMEEVGTILREIAGGRRGIGATGFRG